MNGGGLESSEASRGPAVAGISRAVVPGRHGGPTRSIPVLETLLVPTSYLDLLRVPLQNKGYRTEEAERSRLEGGTRSTIRYTVVLKASRKWPLLYIQDEILTVYTIGNRAALDDLRVLFEDEFRTLYVLHAAQPHGVYRNLAGSWESRYGIRVRFLPISGILDFEQMSLDEQIAYLTRELELEAEYVTGTPPPPPKVPGSDLETYHLRKLIAVLGKISQFDTARNRETFLSVNGLGELVSVVQFEGPREAVAGRVVLELINREGQGFAALVGALQAQGDLGDDTGFVTLLLERYEFR